MTATADVLVIGGGIAGASAAYALAADCSVILLERESQPGYHTTGRSAALFTETYGNAAIRSLTGGGRSFLKSPPEGFCDGPLLTPRGLLFIARADQTEALGRMRDDLTASGAVFSWLGAAKARELCPALQPGYVSAALHDPGAEDIDVDKLHRGFLRGLSRRGGRAVVNAEVHALSRAGGTWVAETKAGRFDAPVVVNAAGAWADEVAVLAGAVPCGLVPKRRTAFTFDPPAGLEIAAWPAVIDADEEFYFKPEAGRLLGSPADETPSPPCDAQPEELDIAIGADRVQTATGFQIRHLISTWAGLRSFFADKTPAVGFDPTCPGFFWLAGQGGYGIQTAPSLSRIAAGLILRDALPEDLAAQGLEKSALAPERFHSGST